MTHRAESSSTPPQPAGDGVPPKPKGLFDWIKFTLLGLGISSPDERRENFKKWEQYRQLREAEENYYGGKHLDDHVREEHDRLVQQAADRDNPHDTGAD